MDTLMLAAAGVLNRPPNASATWKWPPKVGPGSEKFTVNPGECVVKSQNDWSCEMAFI